ncbi:MAG: hypothetical protein Q9169_008071, partial [Polycauliona sp. 2 TL-2023]
FNAVALPILINPIAELTTAITIIAYIGTLLPTCTFAMVCQNGNPLSRPDANTIREDVARKATIRAVVPGMEPVAERKLSMKGKPRTLEWGGEGDVDVGGDEEDGEEYCEAEDAVQEGGGEHASGYDDVGGVGFFGDLWGWTLLVVGSISGLGGKEGERSTWTAQSVPGWKQG